MSRSSGDFERTIGFGEAALDRIRRFQHSAAPRVYELWYTYATGYCAALNQAINDALRTKGCLDEQDLEQLHDDFLSPQRYSTRVEEVGNAMRVEIEDTIGIIDATQTSAEVYGESLGGIVSTLGAQTDREHLQMVIESLTRATRDMRAANSELEQRLAASREQMLVLQDNLRQIRAEVLNDPLTGLANRKSFDAALDHALASSAQSGTPFSFLMCDIDHFKQFNDTFGHLTGDQVLRLVASALKQHVSGQDLAARFGGEEFAIILPETSLRHAVALADQIRRSVMSRELVKRSTNENLGRVTLSIGAATWRPGDSVHSIMERADACLYASKHCGRNRVVCETDPEAATPRQVA